MQRLPRELWLPLPVVFHQALLQRSLVHLLILGEVAATLWVDVVGQHVLPVDVTSHHWVRVALSISVEGRLPEVSSEGRVWEPPGGALVVLPCLVSLRLLLGRLGPLLRLLVLVEPHLSAVVLAWVGLVARAAR